MNKSIVIPCYNEKNTIEMILDRVYKNINKSDNIIIVDDASTDGTKSILKNIENQYPNLKILYHNSNLGKGAALKTALSQNLNSIVIIQDADLEYSPEDYKNLMIPFMETEADVVYGSRFIGGNKYVRIHFFWHYLANKILTFLCNIFSNLNLTDMETGYKAFKSEAIKQINIEQRGFGVEPEITLKLAKKNFKFYEVAVSYNGRSYEEGKKIRLKDAFIAVYCIIRYGIFR